MRPHLVRWTREYGPKGLVVIDVDDGRMDSPDEVRAHVEKDAPPYAVVYDGRGAIVGRYGVLAFPTFYLVGRDGVVVWEGHASPEKIEAEIKKALGL